MKKLFYLIFILLPLLSISCSSSDDDNDNFHILGVKLPQSSAKEPIEHGSVIRIEGRGFKSTDVITFTSKGGDTSIATPAGVFNVTSNSAEVIAPDIQGLQYVSLNRGWNVQQLGALYFAW